MEEDEEEGHVFILGLRPFMSVVVEKAVIDVGDVVTNPKYTHLSHGMELQPL